MQCPERGDVPIQACLSQMAFCAPRQFRPKLLDPTKHGRAINIDAALAQQICNILVRQRVTQIHSYGAQNDQRRKPMTFEWLLSSHLDFLPRYKLPCQKLMLLSRAKRLCPPSPGHSSFSQISSSNADQMGQIGKCKTSCSCATLQTARKLPHLRTH